MKVAVVGHIEWGRFVRVSAMPIAGEIVHTTESWSEVSGGGCVAAMQLAEMAGSCMFFTAVGDDELGRRSIESLEARGVEVYASVIKGCSTKDIFVHVDANGERTITVTGDVKPDGTDSSLPWEKLADVDAVYFVSGNRQALVETRKARVLVSTARILPTLQDATIQMDVLVCSKNDKGETYHDGDLAPRPHVSVFTDGIRGGVTDTGIQYQAEVVPGDEFVDSYGCGDSFAAGLTFGLGEGRELTESLHLAAHCGAEAAKRRGSFGVDSSK